MNELRKQLVGIIKDGCLDKSVDELADAIIAALPGLVQPLVWEEPCAANNWIYQAHAPWGTYGIHICGGRHQAWLEAYVEPYERWLGEGYVGSVLEAQRAAQAHHVATILAAFGVQGGKT